MKILLINKYFYIKGGAENSFFKTAELLEKNGHGISYMSMKHPSNLPTRYSKYFVSNVDYEKKGFRNKIDVSLKLLYSFEAREKIENLLFHEKPDIAHLNVIYHQISPSIIHSLRKYNVSIVMSLRDYKLACPSYTMVSKNVICEACKNGKYYQCFLRKCIKESRIKSLLGALEMYLHHKIMKIYELVDIYISPSMFLKDKMKEMGFKGNIVYLPNFVNLDDFKPCYDHEDSSIVYFGRISKEKGLQTLIDAIKDLPQVELKIIGEGPLRESLETKVKNLGLKNVSFIGYLNGERLKEEIRKSMFVVLPSEWYENNPRSIIEGFALGKPAIGARIGGIPELVKDNITGLTFESGNASDLSNKIKYLIRNENKISEMGKNARKLVEAEYNPPLHYEKLMQIYGEAICKKNE